MTQELDTLVIAVDGGGTVCRAVVARGDTVLGKGTAGPANATTDVTQAIANARAAIDAALTAAGLAQEAAGGLVAHLGLAGALGEELRARVASGIGLPRIRVSDDLETAVAGALGTRDGVLGSVGTGSVLAARRNGTLARIGGWGMQVSDQASGAWLGRALLERALLCHDGLMPHSGLTRAVLADLGGGALDVVRFASTARPADYAALAPRVVAAEGDAHAAAVLAEGADYLRRALAVLDPDGNLPLCLTGGLGPVYAALLPESVRARIVAPEGTALDGALRLAREAAG